MSIYKSPLFAESWNVAYRKRTGGEPFTDLETPFTVIPNPFRYWAADPFVFEHNGEVYIFAELYDYIRCHGVLGYYRLHDKAAGWTPVIEEDFHLSYPCIFRCGEEIFIIPESSNNRDVVLYRAVSFPDEWERDTVLRTNVTYVDTTPFSDGERHMALTYDLSIPALTLLDLDENRDTPLLFPDPDLRRPAGYISLSDGMRAAQDCTEDYGKKLILYRIRFGASGYSETFLKRISPEMLNYSKKLFLDGLHTYNQSESYEVIDIKTRRFNVLNFFVRLLRAIRRKTVS